MYEHSTFYVHMYECRAYRLMILSVDIAKHYVYEYFILFSASKVRKNLAVYLCEHAEAKT